MGKRVRSSAFTLVELLVVIAILGVLMGLLLPALQETRENARRVQCINNLKQIATAILHFEEMHGHLPAGSTARAPDNQSRYLSTWTVDILPHLEQQNVYELWRSDRDFLADENKRLRETFIPTYLCPSDVETDHLEYPESPPRNQPQRWLFAPGSYRAMSGHSKGESGDLYWDNANSFRSFQVPKMPEWTRGPMHVTVANPAKADRHLGPVELEMITDGTSQTLMIGEYHTQYYNHRRTLWAYAYTSYNQSSAFYQPSTLEPSYPGCFVGEGVGVHTCKRAWGSLHRGNRIQFAYCDGSVHSIAKEIEMHVFVAGATIAGGELERLPAE